MNTTIHDVARAAGVSPSTVSRAMSGGTVHPATRETVLRVASDLGYRPSRVARGLITGRTGNLGMLVPDLGNPVFAEIIKAVVARARAGDHPVYVIDTDEDPHRERETIGSLLRSTDGLLLCSPRASDAELVAAAAATPAVVINRKVAGLPAVTADATSGVRLVVQHLGALGHRRIAYVSGPAGSWMEQHRTAGLDIAAALGIEVVTVPSATPTFDSGILAADLILVSGVTAVIAFNDLLALGILQRLTIRGISVPGDISLVGHDDIAMASMCHPPLTTVAVPKDRLGSAAAELLLRTVDAHTRLADDDDLRDVLLPSTLLVRGSTSVATTAG